MSLRKDRFCVASLDAVITFYPIYSVGPASYKAEDKTYSKLQVINHIINSL